MNSLKQRFTNKMNFKAVSGIYWTVLELKGLLEDEDSYVYYERRKKHIEMHPFHVGDCTKALNEILDSRVNSYDAELGGLLLAYKNPALLSPSFGILNDDFFFHMDIEVDLYIFKPDVGIKLKGIVYKKGLDHIGVLVHKTFIVSIPQPKEEEDWPGNKVNIGQEIRFTINQVDFSNKSSKFPCIRGVLNEDEYLEGCKLFNMEIAETDEAIGSSDRKRKITYNEDFISDPSTVSVGKRKRISFDSDSDEGEDQKPKKKKSHKKARISKENSHTLSPRSDDEEIVFKTPQKKSRMKFEDSEEDQKPTHLVQRFTEESENFDEDRKPHVKKSKTKNSESRDEIFSAESEGTREKKKKKKAKFSQESVEEPSSDLEDKKPTNLLATHKSKSNLTSNSSTSQKSSQEPSSGSEDRKPIHILSKDKSKSSHNSEKRIQISENESDVSGFESSQEKKKKSKKKSKDYENVLENESQQVNGTDGHKNRKFKKEKKSEEAEFSFEVLTRIKDEPIDEYVIKELSNSVKKKSRKIMESD